MSPAGFAPPYVAADEWQWGLPKFCSGKQQSHKWGSGGKPSLENYYQNLLPFWRQHWPRCSGEGHLASAVAPRLPTYTCFWAILETGRSVFSWFAGYLYPLWVVQNSLAKGNISDNQLKKKDFKFSFPPEYYVCLFKENLAFLCKWVSGFERETSCHPKTSDGICGWSLALQFRLLDEYGLDWVSGFWFSSP